MSLSLYRKYRPQTFSDIIGQKHIVQTLSNGLVNGRVAHAYLFTGPRGTGKTTMARILARAVNCEHPKGADPCLTCDICKNITEGKSLDIFEIDAASNTGVDNIRELRENVKFPPSHAKFKVYIIDEVHMLSTGAFNALLKTLEEPPAHVIFILATTEIHKVPETIISRCQRFDFTRLSIDHIIEKLSAIAKSEKISIEKDALEMIAIASEGGMRDAESLMSQVISLEDKKITAKEVEEILGTTQRQHLASMAGFLLEKNSTDALLLVSQIAQDGLDLDVFNKSLLNYLRQAMLISVDPKLSATFSFELTKEQLQNLAEQTKGHKPQEVLFILQCFAEIQGKIRSAFIPQLPLEMAIIKATQGAYIPEKNIAPAPPKPQQPVRIEAEKIEEKPVPEAVPESPKVEKITPQSPEIEAPSEAPIEGATFTLSDVKKHWNEAIAQIRPLNHSLASVLPNCQPVSAEAGIITIAAKFSFHKEKLNEIANKLTVESVFAKILGFQLRLRVVTAEEAGIKIASNISTASSIPVEQKPSETSSLLTDAMGIMGGQIVG